MTLETLAYRIATDPEFAYQLQNHPEATIQEEGIELNKEEYDALLAFFANGQGTRLPISDLGLGPIGEAWSVV